MGVSGVRIDAAKHISPDNLSAIFKKLKDNMGGGELPDDFTAYRRFCCSVTKVITITTHH